MNIEHPVSQRLNWIRWIQSWTDATTYRTAHAHSILLLQRNESERKIEKQRNEIRDTHVASTLSYIARPASALESNHTITRIVLSQYFLGEWTAKSTPRILGCLCCVRNNIVLRRPKSRRKKKWCKAKTIGGCCFVSFGAGWIQVFL